MFLCTGFTASAQRTPVVEEVVPQIGVSFRNNRLVFASRADYDRAIGESRPYVRVRIFQQLKALNRSTSTAAAPRAEARTAARQPDLAALIPDDDFRSILNPDLVVQIGDWIIKGDPAAGKVYVLNAAYEAEYADLLAAANVEPARS